MSVFEHDAALTAIVEDIKICGDSVADCIAPVQRVPSCSYKYTVFDNSNYYKIPQTKLAGCSYANELECLPHATKSRETEQHVLDKYICERDLACFLSSNCNSPSFDWLGRQAQNVMNAVLRSHEFDVVNTAFDETLYKPYDAAETLNNGMCYELPADCQLWDPQARLLEKLMCLIEESAPRYNCMVIGRSAMNALRRHPDFLGAGCVISNLTDVDSVRDLLGLDKLCISSSYYDSAPFGADRVLRRFVDDKILLFHRSPTANAPDCGEAQFGWTAQWRDVFSGRIPCDKRGGRPGSFYLRAGWDKDTYVNPELGLLIKGVVSKKPTP